MKYLVYVQGSIAGFQNDMSDSQKKIGYRRYEDRYCNMKTDITNDEGSRYHKHEDRYCEHEDGYHEHEGRYHKHEDGYHEHENQILCNSREA